MAHFSYISLKRWWLKDGPMTPSCEQDLSNVITSIANIPLAELVDAKRRAESEELSLMLTA
ncbi:hypothetical protein DPV78_010816 [Talaromyces pinophilus]|nr:hypothetical protein DPV78_010816 [Talaromyces pinophilus]